jgi:hypothetical protein
VPTTQDVALILKQAMHYIQNQSAAIIYHIEAMEEYRQAAESGTLLNFGEDIADYMDDAPYLMKFSK